MKAWQRKCTGILDNTQFKRRRPNPSMPTQKKNYLRQIPNQKMGMKCQGEESVATCALSKDDIKQTKLAGIISKYRGA